MRFRRGLPIFRLKNVVSTKLSKTVNGIPATSRKSSIIRKRKNRRKFLPIPYISRVRKKIRKIYRLVHSKPNRKIRPNFSRRSYFTRFVRYRTNNNFFRISMDINDNVDRIEKNTYEDLIKKITLSITRSNARTKHRGFTRPIPAFWPYNKATIRLTHRKRNVFATIAKLLPSKTLREFVKTRSASQVFYTIALVPRYRSLWSLSVGGVRGFFGNKRTSKWAKQAMGLLLRKKLTKFRVTWFDLLTSRTGRWFRVLQRALYPWSMFQRRKGALMRYVVVNRRRPHGLRRKKKLKRL